MTKSIAIVVLCFNEEDGLKVTFERYKKVLRLLKFDYEILIINDGSTDRTREIAEELKKSDPDIRIFNNDRPMGMGYGYKLALNNTDKDFLAFTGGYNPIAEESLIHFLEQTGNYDMILGNIKNFDQIMRKVRSLKRNVFSKIFTNIMNFLTGLNLKYYNHMFISSTRHLKAITIRSNKHTFSAECISKLIKYFNCSYKEISWFFDPDINWKKRKTRIPWINLILLIMDSLRNLFFLVCDLYINENKQRARYNLED